MSEPKKNSVEYVLGIKEIYSISVEDRGFQPDPVRTFLANFRKAAQSRGIDTAYPSDAMDMSRDICLDEAARKMGCSWEIFNEKYLCLTPRGVVYDWAEFIEEVEAERKENGNG